MTGFYIHTPLCTRQTAKAVTLCVPRRPQSRQVLSAVSSSTLVVKAIKSWVTRHDSLMRIFSPIVLADTQTCCARTTTWQKKTANTVPDRLSELYCSCKKVNIGLAPHDSSLNGWHTVVIKAGNPGSWKHREGAPPASLIAPPPPPFVADVLFVFRPPL